MNSEAINLELLIHKPPESVRAWWTDYPDDYHAKNPREQPYRIVTTRRFPNGREVRTYWRLPDGSTPELQEVLNLKSDEVGLMNFRIQIQRASMSLMNFALNQHQTEPDSSYIVR